MTRLAVLAAVLTLAGCGLAGCGLDVNLGDLFLVTRTGPGPKLTMLVNQSGQISCNGGKQKMLSSSDLITARDLAVDLVNDATAKLTLPATAGTVYYYRVKLQQGTVSFPDRGVVGHPYLAQLELFTVQAAQQYCGLGS